MSDERGVPWSGQIQEEQIDESGRPAMIPIRFANGSTCRIRKDVYEGIRARAVEEQRKRLHQAERLLRFWTRGEKHTAIEIMYWQEALAQYSGRFPDADV